jgi:hypothetical protein
MPHKNPTTLRRLCSQRENAARSTGPRTREGRRRSALNKREFVFSEGGREIMDHHQGDLREYQRIWRDLLAVFDIMGPEMEPYLAAIAADWWLKAHYAHHPSLLKSKANAWIFKFRQGLGAKMGLKRAKLRGGQSQSIQVKQIKRDKWR